MRTKTQWTAGGVGLWLIAAILATLVVCSQRASGPDPSAESPEIEFEVQGVE